MPDWNHALDRELLLSVEREPSLTWDERGSSLSAKTGVPITADAARNRHKRILQQIDLNEVTPPQSTIDVPPAPQGEYVGFDMAYFDIETTGLGAYGSEMTVACVVDQFGNATTRDKFQFEQRHVLDDRGLCLWLRDELEKYDILVAWYGTMFDIPYLNARLIVHGERPMRRMKVIDPCFKVRGGRYGLKMGGSKLKTVGRALRVDHEKPELEWDTFRLAGHGDVDALRLLRDRCEQDCQVLRDIFGRIKKVITTVHE